MKSFLDQNLLLKSEAEHALYHDFVEIVSIIQYHNCLPPDQIAVNLNFGNLTKARLNGDHSGYLLS
jgi:glucuronate isomerase